MAVRPRARKRYGQHFLEAAWADKVLAAIDPDPADRFVEIGPGPGALTLRLAPRVSELVAVEVDAAMVATLRPHLPANVHLVHADFLEFDLSALTRRGPLRVAGNLPYNLSSPILFKLIRDHRSGGGIRDATLMLQREVADRLDARTGTREYGVLSVLVGLHADVHRLLTLPPGAFRPPPKVYSAVVRLAFREPAIRLRDEAVFEETVRSVFTRRRKTMLNALRPAASARGLEPAHVLQEAGIEPHRRPETLNLSEFGRIADTLAAAE